EGGPSALAEFHRILRQWASQFHRSRKVTGFLTVAVWIAGECHVAKFDQPLRALFGVSPKSKRFGHHQDSRPLARLAFIIGEKALQSDFPIAIINRLGLHQIAPVTGIV